MRGPPSPLPSTPKIEGQSDSEARRSAGDGKRNRDTGLDAHLVTEYKPDAECNDFERLRIRDRVSRGILEFGRSISNCDGARGHDVDLLCASGDDTNADPERDIGLAIVNPSAVDILRADCEPYRCTGTLLDRAFLLEGDLIAYLTADDERGPVEGVDVRRAELTTRRSCDGRATAKASLI